MGDKSGPRKTPFYEHHRALGGKIVEFAGWMMPIQYEGILKEHQAVRGGAGIFDVSHMGRLELSGKNAIAYAQYLTTNDVAALEPGMVQYSTICNDSGGILDDVTVYRYADRILMVVNASNTPKIWKWVLDHRQSGVEIRDLTGEIAQLAIQGPKSQEILQTLASFDLDPIPFYQFQEGEVAGIPCMVSRTGYTGEDGFEIYFPVRQADKLWKALIGPRKLTPCGLGARDILRLEMKYCLYGNDIDETTSPLEAGLGWLVKLEKDEFIGRGALLEAKAKGIRRRLAGFSLLEKGIPRPGYPVRHDGEAVSKVASGAYSPSLDGGIGTAYLAPELAKEGNGLEIDIRGKGVGAEVVKTPFYTEGSRR